MLLQLKTGQVKRFTTITENLCPWSDSMGRRDPGLCTFGCGVLEDDYTYGDVVGCLEGDELGKGIGKGWKRTW